MATKSVKKRAFTVFAIAIPLAIAAALVFFAMRDNIMYFRTPSDIAEKTIPAGTPLRLGGLVAKGSVMAAPDGMITAFTVTDGANAIPVQYEGVLPSLFREGQGVVAEGSFNSGGLFIATTLLAKHDENYMPPPLKKKAGKAHEEATTP